MNRDLINLCDSDDEDNNDVDSNDDSSIDLVDNHNDNALLTTTTTTTNNTSTSASVTISASMNSNVHTEKSSFITNVIVSNNNDSMMMIDLPRNSDSDDDDDEHDELDFQNLNTAKLQYISNSIVTKNTNNSNNNTHRKRIQQLLDDTSSTVIDLVDTSVEHSAKKHTKKNDESTTTKVKRKSHNYIRDYINGLSSDNDSDDELLNMKPNFNRKKSVNVRPEKNNCNNECIVQDDNIGVSSVEKNEIRIDMNKNNISNNSCNDNPVMDNVISLLSDEEDDVPAKHPSLETKETLTYNSKPKAVTFKIASNYKSSALDSSDDDEGLFSPVPFVKKKKRSIPLSCDKRPALDKKRDGRSNDSILAGDNKRTIETSSSVRSRPNLSVSTTDIDFNSNDLLSPTLMITPNTSATSANQTAIPSTNILTPSGRMTKVPTPSLPQIDVSKIGGKLYPDYRHEFIQALDLHARKMRLITHQRRALDSCIQAIVTLSLYKYPVRTSYAASSIKGVGDTLLDVLKEAEEKCKNTPYNPPQNMFSSVTSAALVCLLEYELEQSSENVLCTMEELLRRINDKVHYNKKNVRVFPKDIDYYLDKNNIDPGWMQVSQLYLSSIENMYLNLTFAIFVRSKN